MNDYWDLTGGYLMHHGIKNQKWGVRNGPPYPLDSRKAKIHRKGKTARASYSKFKSGLEDVKQGIAARAKLIPFVAAGVAGTFLTANPAPVMIAAAGGTAFLIASDSNGSKKANYISKDGPIEKVRNLKKKENFGQQNEPDFDSKFVNKQGMFKYGYKSNCTGCSMAMEMRRRGYDVKARRMPEGISTKKIETVFKDAKFTNFDGDLKNNEYYSNSKRKQYFNKLCDNLESFGPRARGMMNVRWLNGMGGHSVFWENDKNGTLHIYDAQSNTKNPYYFADISPNVQYLRTDKLKLNGDEICKYIVSR